MNNDEKFGCLKIDEIQIDLDEMSDEELAKIEDEIVKSKVQLRKIIDEALEIVEISTVVNNENMSGETTEKTIEKLLEKQYQHSIVKAVRNIKRSRDLINTNAIQLEKYISAKAREYGQSAELLNEDVVDFKDMLEQINNELNNVKKSLMKIKEEIQNTEYEKILILSRKRDERKLLKKSDDYKNYRTQINNLNRELIKEMENESPNDIEIKRLSEEIEKLESQDQLVICEREIQDLRKDIIEARKLSIEIDKQIDQYTANLKDYIENASKNGELIISNNKKTKGIQKFFLSFINKFAGANKFEDNVVKAIKAKINKMKTLYLPDVLKKVNDDGIDGVSIIIEKKLKVQKIPENSVDTKNIAQQELSTIVDKFKNIIENGNDKRKMFIKVEM